MEYFFHRLCYFTKPLPNWEAEAAELAQHIRVKVKEVLTAGGNYFKGSYKDDSAQVSSAWQEGQRRKETWNLERCMAEMKTHTA